MTERVLIRPLAGMDPTGYRDLLRLTPGWETADVIVHARAAKWEVFALPAGGADIVRGHTEKYGVETTPIEVLHSAIRAARTLADLREALLGTHTGVPCQPLVPPTSPINIPDDPS